MLLLVLILVVLAFGLLVFALQAGSVVAAWVSVGLSVAAALVLVVDWFQRRSAMRAGAASVKAAGGQSLGDQEVRHDPEPATEVLPVIPPSGPVPVQHAQDSTDAPTMVAAPLGGHAPGEPAEDREAGPDGGPADGERTVLMPAVQPSGSAAGPSGATQGLTGSGGSSSLSVVKSSVDTGADDLSREDPEQGSDAPGDATVAVDTSKRTPAAEKSETSAESRTDSDAEMVDDEDDEDDAGVAEDTADVDTAAATESGDGPPVEPAARTDLSKGADSKGSDSKGSDSKGSDSKGTGTAHGAAAAVAGVRAGDSNLSGR
ncbi:MAG: hypothetical protein L0H84_22665, partial [Pseudonocardia sp.]|nr:hypothetical protein [Pseudonocardia sp.]